MANTTFPKGSQRILSAGINFLTDTIKAALLPSTYTYSTAHEFVSDLGTRIGTDQALANKSIAGGVPDADTFDVNRSERAEAEFTKYFGLRPDADARRDTRTDQVHHNHAIF